MILLSYFDRIIGPKVFITNPPNLIEDLDEEYLNQIKSLLDSNDEGFFTHYFSSELKTANWIFTIKSNWARGRSEIAMISAIISEEEPDYVVYEKIFSKFLGKIKNIPDIYKAFYVDVSPRSEQTEIESNLLLLREELENVYKIVSIKKIETEGHLLSFSEIENKKVIDLSSDILKKLSFLTENKPNCFLVFRTRGEAMKLDIIPLTSDINRVIRLAIIFGEEMTVMVLQQITQIFSKYEDKLSLIFTSGICQEVDKCIYEVYINTEIDTLNKIIEEIYKISGILEMEVKLIRLNPQEKIE